MIVCLSTDRIRLTRPHLAVAAGMGSLTDHPIYHYTTMPRTLYWYLGEPKLHRKKLVDLLEL